MRVWRAIALVDEPHMCESSGRDMWHVNAEWCEIHAVADPPTGLCEKCVVRRESKATDRLTIHLELLMAFWVHYTHNE